MAKFHLVRNRGSLPEKGEPRSIIVDGGRSACEHRTVLYSHHQKRGERHFVLKKTDDRILASLEDGRRVVVSAASFIVSPMSARSVKNPAALAEFALPEAEAYRTACTARHGSDQCLCRSSQGSYSAQH